MKDNAIFYFPNALHNNGRFASIASGITDIIVMILVAVSRFFTYISHTT